MTDLRNILVNRLHFKYGERTSRQLARWLLEDLTGWRPGDILRSWTAAEQAKLDNAVDRLLADEPIQYITGRADFFGYTFAVSPAVLIPRPETEELVEWILQTWQTEIEQTGPCLDIGTGSGCIPISLALEGIDTRIVGVDVSVAALEVARENGQVLKADVQFRQLDILDPAQWAKLGRYRIIVSNPPYIPERERALMTERVLTHEPDLALFVPDDDALLFYRTIVQCAQAHLLPEGYLFFECNEYSATAVAAILEKAGFTDVQLRNDMQGKFRMVRGVLPGNRA